MGHPGKNQQQILEEQRKAREAKKQAKYAAIAEKKHRAMLKNEYNASQGIESKHTGVMSKDAHDRQAAADARYQKNLAARQQATAQANTPQAMNSNNKDATAGGKYNSAANQALNAQRQSAVQRQNAINTAQTHDPNKAASLRAAAQNATKQRMRSDLNQTKTGQTRANIVEANNDIRNGHILAGAGKKIKHAFTRGGQAIKNVFTRENANVDTISDIYNEALENIDVWTDILCMDDNDFSILMESMSTDELMTLNHIMAIESAADIIDTILDAAESDDPDSDDVLLEACAVFSEYGIDDAYSAILECAI